MEMQQLPYSKDCRNLCDNVWNKHCVSLIVLSYVSMGALGKNKKCSHPSICIFGCQSALKCPASLPLYLSLFLCSSLPWGHRWHRKDHEGPSEACGDLWTQDGQGRRVSPFFQSSVFFPRQGKCQACDERKRKISLDKSHYVVAVSCSYALRDHRNEILPHTLVKLNVHLFFYNLSNLL